MRCDPASFLRAAYEPGDALCGGRGEIEFQGLQPSLHRQHLGKA